MTVLEGRRGGNAIQRKEYTNAHTHNTVETPKNEIH